MSLIKVLDIGFGLTGTRVDITIAIPKDTYLYSFRIYNQKDVVNTNCSSSMGTDYIELYSKTEGSREGAFHKLFGEAIDHYTDKETQQEFDVYKLGETEVTGISQKDITFVSMELLKDAETCSDTKWIEPLFNLTPMRLAALDAAKSIKENCSIPREFMDKLLQIKAVEVALCCGAYCDAAKYWNMFWGNGTTKTIKKCGCHGGIA